MSEPLARLYDLALRTLDDQQQRADTLRARLGPILAAAALGVTLLSGPLVGSGHPATVPGSLALLVAVGGFFAAIAGAIAVLVAPTLAGTETDVPTLARTLSRNSVLDDVPAFYEAMIAQFGGSAVENTKVLDSLLRRFTAMLCGILAMLCGLALAALIG